MNEATASAATSSNLMSIGLIVVMIAIMYFLMIRPQRKRQKEEQQMDQTPAPDHSLHCRRSRRCAVPAAVRHPGRALP